MAYGIIVNGVAGRLVIDKDYSNYTQVASGSVSVSFIASNICKGIVPVSSSYVNPVILFQPPVGKAVSYWGSKLYGYSTSSFSVPYRICVPVSSIGPSYEPYGIKVFDASGKCVFDSGHSVLNTLSAYSYSGTGLPTINATSSDWVMATTWGIVMLGSLANANEAHGLAVYLEKLGNGDFASHLLPVDIRGPESFSGSRTAYNSIYLNRCEVL
jgi:hypothetical protein